MFNGQNINKNENYEYLTTSVLRALAFFDMFDFPLTLSEVHSGLDAKCDFQELAFFVDKLVLGDVIKKDRGFYFLKDRVGIVENRIKQYNLVQKKYKLAKRAARLFKYINGVKLAAVCNNFSYQEKSDIDFFIITGAGRIWLTRFLVTVAAQVFGLRRHGKKITDRICLSFYVSEKGMGLEELMLKDNANPRIYANDANSNYANCSLTDPYFTYWVPDLMPFYDDGIMNKFWEVNSWVRELLPNASLPVVNPRFLVYDNLFSLVWKKINGIWFEGAAGNFLDNVLKKLQMKKMAFNTHSLAKAHDSRVVISDEVLKFHEEDRREEYKRKWEKKFFEIKKLRN